MSRYLIVSILLLSVSCCPAKTEQPDSCFTVSNSNELQTAARKMNPSGGTIILKPGTYILEKPLIFEKKNLVHLEGSGWNTQMARKGEGDAIVFKDSAFCVVRNLLLLGDTSAKKGSGIVFKGGSSCTVDYCRICTFPESGVLFDGDPKSPMSSNSVRNCHFIDNNQHQLHSINNNDFYFIGNQFGTHGLRGLPPKSGARLDRSAAGTYSENYHWGNVNALILASGSHFNRIENNRFEESSESGIVIGEPNGAGTCHNTFIGNTIHTNSKGSFGVYPAVIAYHASSVIFSTNQIFSWDSNSTRHKSALVLADGCSAWIVKDNIFRHCTDKPLVYDESGHHIVKDNITD